MDQNNYIAEEWAKHFAKKFGQRSVFDSLIIWRRRTWRERWFTLPWLPWVKVVAELPPPCGAKGDKVKISLVPDTQHVMQQEATGFERRLLNPRVQGEFYVKVAGWKPHGPAPCTDMMIEGSEEWLPEEPGA